MEQEKWQRIVEVIEAKGGHGVSVYRKFAEVFIGAFTFLLASAEMEQYMRIGDQHQWHVTL